MKLDFWVHLESAKKMGIKIQMLIKNFASFFCQIWFFFFFCSTFRNLAKRTTLKNHQITNAKKVVKNEEKPCSTCFEWLQIVSKLLIEMLVSLGMGMAFISTYVTLQHTWWFYRQGDWTVWKIQWKKINYFEKVWSIRLFTDNLKSSPTTIV